jgi:hypothetical protein
MNVSAAATCVLVAMLAVGPFPGGAASGDATATSSVAMLPELQSYIDVRTTEFDLIVPERIAALDGIAAYVAESARAGKPAQLTFICTHNSRRSHMCQIWAAVAAAHYAVPGVTTYSGGTEVSAFNPRAVDALRRAGLDIERTTDATNPIYHVRFATEAPALTCFSKVYSNSPNPTRDFGAVLTCAQADDACPLVAGADGRFSIPYEDPKVFDSTKAESQKYDERCAQIAREMLYLCSRVERAR